MLFDIIVAVMIFTSIGVLAMNNSARRAFMAEYDIAVQRGRIVAAQAELFRQQVTNAAAGTPWVIDFATQANFISSADFAAALGISLPATTPWGSNYEIRADNTVAVVRFDVPADYQNAGREAPAAGTITVNPDGTAVVTLQAIKGLTNGAHHRPMRLKTTFYNQGNRS